MKRILFVYHTSVIGGGSNCLINIIRRLDRGLFYPQVLLKEPGPLSEELKKLDVQVHFCRFIQVIPYNQSLFKISTVIGYTRVLFSTYFVLRRIIKLQIDAVYLNTFMLYYLVLVKFFNIESYIHLREHWPKSENQVQFKIGRFFAKNLAKKIIAINKTSADILNLPSKTEIVYDWTEYYELDYQLLETIKKQYGIDDNLKIVLFLGGFQFIKGFKEVVYAFQQYVSNNTARLVIVGADLANLAERRNLKYYLKIILNMIGLYSKKKIITHLVESDNRIILVPSLNRVREFYEIAHCVVAFPMIPHAILPIVESIFLDKIVVASETPESLEYSINGSLAKIIPFRDTKSLGILLGKIIDKEYIPYNIKEENIKVLKDMFDPIRNSSKLNCLLK